MRASMVRKQIGAASVKMLAYNGSVPGPTLKVKQGAEVTITVANETDLPTTVHWHGIRLDNRFDGAPHATQVGLEAAGDEGATAARRRDRVREAAGLLAGHHARRRDRRIDDGDLVARRQRDVQEAVVRVERERARSRVAVAV